MSGTEINLAIAISTRQLMYILIGVRQYISIVYQHNKGVYCGNPSKSMEVPNLNSHLLHNEFNYTFEAF